MCNMNVVNIITCFCLIKFFLEGTGSDFGYSGHLVATSL